jgi:hypothetical protein
MSRVKLNTWYISKSGAELLSMFFEYKANELCVMMRQEGRESETTPTIPYYHHLPVEKVEGWLLSGQLKRK